MAKLTEKQKRFVEEYLVDLNATQAYIRAGYKAKENAAAVSALKLLRNDKIQKEIQKVLKKISSKKIADVQEVMEYLTSVMRREYTENIVVTTSEETSKYVPDAKGTMRKQTIKREVPQVVEIPAKLSDANKAAELLGKRYALFSENVNLSADVGIKIVDDISNDGEDS